ncbi:type VI immunity family protein [Hyalangium sp.]|uniref:type VI immunity family protein n=1 Tax=Hyalangium sp. TaxID=2028555 RepID=UPI002D5FD656|nr:type VI immunity family protein [Hyalangium sp.]HYH96609.1 type VI immunity family protein [Hyalangium sp.]
MRENIPVIRLKTDTDRLVARDGVVLCFFMRRSHPEVAPAIWRALQTYLRATPPQSLAWYGSDDGDTLPLDDKGWQHIRKRILERPGGIAWIVELEENCSEVGGYHFEYHGRKLDDPLYSHDEDATSGVAFSFPTEYLLEHGPAHFRALALELARELPFSFGYASLAFVAPHGLWYAARRELIGYLTRYLGLDLYHLTDTSRAIGTRARGAYWLTFLGQPLLGQLGGLEGLRHTLPFPDVSFQSMEGERLLISLGEWPDAIDTAKAHHPPQYRALAQLLEPFLYEERTGFFSLNKDNMRRWLRRLC